MANAALASSTRFIELDATAWTTNIASAWQTLHSKWALLALLVPGGCLICTVHRDVWDEGGFGNGLQALTEARVASLRSREADSLFADKEPSGWYVVVEKLSC